MMHGLKGRRRRSSSSSGRKTMRKRKTRERMNEKTCGEGRAVVEAEARDEGIEDDGNPRSVSHFPTRVQEPQANTPNSKQPR